jgi:hypothetical protein
MVCCVLFNFHQISCNDFVTFMIQVSIIVITITIIIIINNYCKVKSLWVTNLRFLIFIIEVFKMLSIHNDIIYYINIMIYVYRYV